MFSKHYVFKTLCFPNIMFSKHYVSKHYVFKTLCFQNNMFSLCQNVPECARMCQNVPQINYKCTKNAL